jgi:hypothetical protein
MPQEAEGRRRWASYGPSRAGLGLSLLAQSRSALKALITPADEESVRPVRGTLKRALTIGALSLTVVLMIGAAAFAGSLGQRVAHDSDSGHHPEVSAVAHIQHPHALRIKIRAAPEAKIDWGYDVGCSRRRHGSISGETGESSTRRLPKIVRVQPTFRHPYKCTLKAHASYDKAKRGRLVLNLYAKK